MKRITVFLSDRQACKGNRLFRQPIVSRVLNPSPKRERQSAATAAPALTSRQLEVLQHIAEGYSSKRIARLLSLSTKTVEKHRQAVMDKLDIHEIATLTRYAVASGVVEPFPVEGWRAGAGRKTGCHPASP